MRFLAVLAVSLTLFVATYLVFVGTAPGQRIENVALLGAELRSDAEVEAALGRLSIVTVAIFALAVVVVLAVGFLRRREPLAGGRRADGGWWCSPRSSRPSSPTRARRGPGLAAAQQLPERERRGRRLDRHRRAAGGARSVALGDPGGRRAFAALIGEAVQTTGWHRLSDTLGGVLLVIAVAAAGLSSCPPGFVSRRPRPTSIPRLRGLLLIGGAGAVIVGAVLAVLPAIFPLLGTPDDARRSILQTAFPLVGAGVTVSAVVAFARVIEPYSLGRRSTESSPD